jgi:RNA polymerase sigma-70 factor (ECF subfamily)
MDERAQALERIYRERYLGFRNALATITGDYETARDVVQEAFARALKNRASFRGEGALESWVWRIAIRTALELRGEHPAAKLNGAIDPVLVDPARDPELAEALRQLPPRRRLIVFLRYFADLTYAQIADVCGIDEGTVAATLAQARAALEEALTEGAKP